MNRFFDLNHKLLLLLFLAASVAYPLYVTAKYVPTTPEGDRKEISARQDITDLYTSASHAKSRDMLKWWTGSWIYPDCNYYRPVTSMLYFAEYKSFGSRFEYYNRVSWLLHGLNAALICLLMLSLFSHHSRLKYPLGISAAWFFSSTEGCYSFGVLKAISWWPAQNDVMSLSFALLCLILLDQGLKQHRRSLYCASLLAFAFSVWTKEMGYITLPLALMLIVYRKGVLYKELAGYVITTAMLWSIRRLAVPDPWSPGFKLKQHGMKLLMSWGGPVYGQLASGIWWGVTAVVLLMVLIGAALHQGWRWIYVFPAAITIIVLCAQLIGPGWEILVLASSWITMLRLGFYMLAPVLFWRYRRSEPGWYTGACLLLVFLPILNYGGMHYFYWPAAFQGMADAGLCLCIYRGVREMPCFSRV